MYSRKTSDNLITLSLTEAAFILVFAVLLLIGSKLLLVVQDEQKCASTLSQCAIERRACQGESAACKSLLAKVVAKPDDILTTLVDQERLRLENAELKTKVEAALRELDGLIYLQEKLPKDPARLHTALELLTGFEAEKGASLDGEGARKRGEEAARASKDLQNCRGQLKNCTAKLGPRGYGHPPCWTDSSGGIQYIFDVELRTDGVAVTARWPAERGEDARALAGAVELGSGAVMRLEEFRARTASIFAASRAATPECRHYVRLLRSPALKDIDLFNRLRLGVEDHFYKLDLTKSGS